MRNEEPWPSLNKLWSEIFKYRDQIYLERAELNTGDPNIPILQAKLDATRDVQKMFFEILQAKLKELKNDHPS